MRFDITSPALAADLQQSRSAWLYSQLAARDAIPVSTDQGINTEFNKSIHMGIRQGFIQRTFKRVSCKSVWRVWWGYSDTNTFQTLPYYTLPKRVGGCMQGLVMSITASTMAALWMLSAYLRKALC